MRAWPVGIDTRVFRPGEQQRTRILVYHKWRDPNELAQLISVLSNKGLQYDLVRYGAYEEREYVEKLLRARYVIWHGGHESQGIALQEAMACDVPIVVWDVTSLAQFYSGGAGYCFGPTERDLPATTAPYFDLACGIRVTSVDELTIAVERMEGEWDRLHPRVYVEEHLSLEKQARELVAMFDNQISGASEVVREGSWRPPLRSVARAAWNRLWRATWRRHGAPILERIFERKQQ
jgi:glycosyltransferase involved in cell wall biosynthesis